MAAAAAVLSYDASPISLHIASFIAAGEGREKGRKGGREGYNGIQFYIAFIKCDRNLHQPIARTR
jgi:hypothetical protein